MKKIFLAGTLLSAIACNQQADKTSPAETPKPFSVTDKKVVVYTTADSTNLRLTITDTLQFKDLPQPVETEVCVFVDPGKTFQTLLGIGGALTDASAETFAKLPKD